MSNFAFCEFKKFVKVCGKLCDNKYISFQLKNKTSISNFLS